MKQVNEVTYYKKEGERNKALNLGENLIPIEKWKKFIWPMSI